MSNKVRAEQEYIKHDRILVGLLVLACFLSNISQLPYFVSTGMTQMLNMPAWIILLGYLFITKQIKVYYRMIAPFGLLFLAVAGMMIGDVFFGKSYFNSSVFTSLILSLFIYCLGEFSNKNIREEDLKIIVIAYATSVCIVAADVYLKYFSSGFDLSSRVYAYSSKNSISQIIFTSVVILMFLKTERHKIANIIRVIAIFFEVFLLILLRSRATIVGFLICLIYIVLGKGFNKKLKYFISFILVLGAIILLTNDAAYNSIFNNVLFAGRDVTNLDALTSGRATILSTFPTIIKGNWLTGVGSTYFECFPLSVILQFGIIIGLFVIIIAYQPIIKCFSFKRNNVYVDIFIIVCVGYAINSLFEGLAPIGPGVKCYFMWLMFGILSGQKTGRRNS